MKQFKFVLLLVVFVVVCALPVFAVDWQPIYEGVDYGFLEKTSPRLMKAFALRIDTQNPNVSFFATPDNGGSPRETTRQTTPTFRSTYGLEAAVNANFFSTDDPNYAYVQGLLISNGTTVSLDEVNRQSQLRITAAKAASIAFGGNPTGIHTAVAGDWLVVQGGANVGDPNSPINPMTGVGVSQDARYVIWCVVDGRQPGWSDGARYSDLGQFLIDFGAWNGYAADGGGSSCICTASGVLNRPSDGTPRKVGANIGVNTVALPAPTEIIIDNPQGSWSANWTLSTGSTQKYGADYRWRSTQAVSDAFTWTPNIPTAGNYEVYAWWSAGSNRSTTAPYLIYYNGGSANVPKNQQTAGGQWNSLGTYNFAAGTGGSVKLSCWTTAGYVVVADAVKFVKR